VEKQVQIPILWSLVWLEQYLDILALKEVKIGDILRIFLCCNGKLDFYCYTIELTCGIYLSEENQNKDLIQCQQGPKVN
jgi:hypothetical protein